MINGREVRQKSRTDEAKYIAEQGMKWAERAVRREDEEVYLFRVLVEWGRVVKEEREELKFVLGMGETSKEEIKQARQIKEMKG